MNIIKIKKIKKEYYPNVGKIDYDEFKVATRDLAYIAGLAIKYTNIDVVNDVYYHDDYDSLASNDNNDKDKIKQRYNLRMIKFNALKEMLEISLNPYLEGVLKFKKFKNKEEGKKYYRIFLDEKEIDIVADTQDMAILIGLGFKYQGVDNQFAKYARGVLGMDTHNNFLKMLSKKYNLT